MAAFYTEYTNDPTARDRYYEKQIQHRGQTRSSFFRVTVASDEITVEIEKNLAPEDLRSLPEFADERFGLAITPIGDG